MTTHADEPPASSRTRCKRITEESWYTDAVLTQNDFSACTALKPELKTLAGNIVAYEEFIFKSYELRYLELKAVMGYQSPNDISAITLTKPISENGGAIAKLHRLFICYRLFDRIWLYNDISHRNNIMHQKTLKLSKLKEPHYSHIENIKALLQNFRKMATEKSRTKGGPLTVVGTGITKYGPRLPPGSGVCQQLKDIAVLGQVGNLRKIERNFLFTALSLNCLASTKDSPESDTASVDASEQTSELMSLAQHTLGFSEHEVSLLKNMFVYKDNGCIKWSDIHKGAHMVFAITPMFLVAPFEIDKSKWSIKSIHKEAHELGNWTSPLLMQIEATILDGVFALANGSMDVTQVLGHILNTLPWDVIDALDDEDLTSVRFRTLVRPPNVKAASSAMSQLSVANGSAQPHAVQSTSAHQTTIVQMPALSTVQQVSPSTLVRQRSPGVSTSPGTPPPHRTHTPTSSPTPTPTSSRQPSPISAETPQRPTAGEEGGESAKEGNEEEQSLGEENTGGNPEEENSREERDTHSMDMENDNRERNDEDDDDDAMSSKIKSSHKSGRSGDNSDGAGNDMDVDFSPRSRRYPPRATLQSKPQGTKKRTGARNSGKRKRIHNEVESPEFVPKDTPVGEIGVLASIRNTPFPEGIKFELAEPNLDVASDSDPLLNLPAMTAFCPNGNAQDITFRAHNDFMLQFWKLHAEKVKDSYIGGEPLHKAKPEASVFTVVSYSDMQTMSTTAKLKLLQRAHILETGRPIRPVSFDKKGMSSLQYSLDGLLDIQDQSIDGSENMNNWLQQGTLKMLLQCKDRKALNALDIPMAEGPQSADELSTDTVAWWETLRSAWNAEPNATRPASDTRWGVGATTGAASTFHLDSDGFGSHVEVLTGAMVWFALRSKHSNQIADFSEFRQIKSFMGDHFDLLDIGQYGVEAVVLTPGTRLYMRPNTMHAAYTSENAICHGGHFFATPTMKDTLCGLIQTFCASDYMKNTYHPGSRLLLRRIITFYFEGLEQNKFDKDDPVREHLPQLRPEEESEDSEVNSMLAFENLFAACCLGIFSNVLDPQTYSHPEVDDGYEPNNRQQEEMDRYDRNALSVDEHYAYANARGQAYKLLDWFSAHYQLVRMDKDLQSETRKILDSKLAQQAYAIYLAKKKAVDEEVGGFTRCSLVAMKQQLLGTFEPESKAYIWLEDRFKTPHAMLLLHADFSKWSLKIKTPPDAYVPTPVNQDVFLKTPLDCKFEQGFKINFRIIDEPPLKRRKIV